MRNGMRVQQPDEAYFGAESRNGEVSTTYYDRPLLKAPEWGGSVVAYLFLGGVMGGLGLIQLLCDAADPDERKLKRSTRVTSFALAAANPGILITHLGRPERFLHMLRIVKVKSPMSLGVWGLVLYSGAAGANTLRELTDGGVLPRWMRAFAPGIMAPAQALIGGFIASYTGVLLSATANPFWSSGKRHIPALTVASGFSSACALSTLLSVFERNDAVTHKLERLEAVSSVCELALLTHFERHAGDYGKPFFTGEIGARLRKHTITGGIVVPLALNILGNIVKLPKPLERVRALTASTLTLIGGYVFRQALIEGGKASADDPRAAFVQPK
jgi:formate-dependent nitrite reductase membrane component NrfD